MYANIGHFGTGDLEITIASDDDLERAKPLIVKAMKRIDQFQSCDEFCFIHNSDKTRNRLSP